MASLEQLKVGVKVIHPNFGLGTVEALKIVAKGNPWKSKISVKFEEYSESKTLIIGRAKLRLHSDNNINLQA